MPPSAERNKTYRSRSRCENQEGISLADVEKKNHEMSCLDELIAVGKFFSERKWILGTAGNFSAAISRQPLELAITQRGADKRALKKSDFIHLSEYGYSLDGRALPAETPIHWAIISNLGARAVLQTHSVWSTVLADVCATSGGVELEGFAALRGQSPTGGGRPAEWVPIVETSEDYPALVPEIDGLLKTHSETQAIMLRKCGLYTWGTTVAEAVRHVVILEFLFEVLVRKLHIFGQGRLLENRGPLM